MGDFSLLKEDSLVVTAGYGITNEETKEQPTKVQYGVFPIIDVIPGRVRLENDDNSGICFGDSGGPSFVETNGGLEAWGITSKGRGKGAKDCNRSSDIVRLDYHKSFIAPYLDK